MRNPYDPYAKQQLSDAVTIAVGLAITAAIISQIVKSSEPIIPLSPQEFMNQTVKPITTVADRVVPPSPDQTVAQVIQNPPAPTTNPSTVQPPLVQDVCLQWDLAHASPGGVVPCLRWGTSSQVIAQGTSAVTVPVAFTPEISKLEGVHMNGDFGRRL